MFIINDIIAFLAANLVLSQALGTSTLFIAADNLKKLVGTAFLITFFTTFGSAAAYLTDRFLPSGAEYLTLLCYVFSVGILYILLLFAIYAVKKDFFAKVKKYIHVASFNCAVIGTLFTINGKSSADSSKLNLPYYISSGFEAGIGFVAAAVILAAAYGRLNSEKVPRSFCGFPAMLIYLGIISTALYTLAN